MDPVKQHNNTQVLCPDLLPLPKYRRSSNWDVFYLLQWSLFSTSSVSLEDLAKYTNYDGNITIKLYYYHTNYSLDILKVQT